MQFALSFVTSTRYSLSLLQFKRSIADGTLVALQSSWTMKRKKRNKNNQQVKATEQTADVPEKSKHFLRLPLSFHMIPIGACGAQCWQFAHHGLFVLISSLVWFYVVVWWVLLSCHQWQRFFFALLQLTVPVEKLFLKSAKIWTSEWCQVKVCLFLSLHRVQ